MFWTDEKISTVKELWGKESSFLIAEKIGTTKNAVIGKAHRLKLPKIVMPEKTQRGIIKVKVKRLPRIMQTVEPEMVRRVKRGKCQWIEGHPVKRRITDEGKCLRPTVYRDNGQRSPYCWEHTEKAWRKVPLGRIKL